MSNDSTLIGPLSVEGYLELEATSPIRHELVGGMLFPLDGGNGCTPTDRYTERMENFVTPLGPLSVEEYLELEASSPIKHEFVAGMLFALGGGSDRHNRIAGNILSRYMALGVEAHVASTSATCVFASAMTTTIPT